MKITYLKIFKSDDNRMHLKIEDETVALAPNFLDQVFQVNDPPLSYYINRFSGQIMLLFL